MKTAAHILSERVGDERIVLDLKNEEYLSLNPVGNVVWEALHSGLSQSEAVECVLNEFECERDQAADDVRRFVYEIVHLGLIPELG